MVLYNASCMCGVLYVKREGYYGDINVFKFEYLLNFFWLIARDSRARNLTESIKKFTRLIIITISFASKISGKF